MLLVAAMAVLSAAAAVVFGEICDRVAVPQGVRRGFALVLAALALAGVGVVWSSEGPPWQVADRAWQRFTAPPKQSETNVTSRLFDLSSTCRVDLWRVSVDQFEANPLKGDGAGSFAAVWFQERPITLYSREGHSLYAETLGELGLVGLALLVAALAVPLAAAVRRRRDPLVAVALAPYAAFLAHAGVDWDWELAGVTLVALLAGAALVVTARGDMAARVALGAALRPPVRHRRARGALRLPRPRLRAAAAGADRKPPGPLAGRARRGEHRRPLRPLVVGRPAAAGPRGARTRAGRRRRGPTSVGRSTEEPERLRALGRLRRSPPRQGGGRRPRACGRPQSARSAAAGAA